MAAQRQHEADDAGGWNCPVCLEPPTKPKLLPCSHTFCEACLEGLARNSQSRSFKCPSCRENIQVPKGGVSAFKKTTAESSSKTLCKEGGHEEKERREVELYCHDCQLCICLKCKIDRHMSHNTQEIEHTAVAARARVSRDMAGMGGVINDLRAHLVQFTKEKQAVADKRAAVAKEIARKHRLIVDAAERSRVEALFSLDTITASINSKLTLVTTDLQNNVDELTKLRKRMETCVHIEEGKQLVVTAGDIYKDATKLEQSVQRLKGTRLSSACRPVLQSSASVDLAVATQEKFLGRVVRMDMPLHESQEEVIVQELFRCVGPPPACGASEIFSLCPTVHDEVWVAYEPSPKGEGTVTRCPELRNLSGKVIETESSVQGRTNFTYTALGAGMQATQTAGFFSTFAKSRRCFKLKNNLQGQACVISLLIKSHHPLQTFKWEVLPIQCGLHRAFDVDETELLFAVVEEVSDCVRRVHTYQSSDGTPLRHTYDPPPCQPFLPSDVCFFRLAGRQVLLVADEVSDAIHVLDVDAKGRLTFSRYFAAGCPLLLRPTALNTDVRGRLWVGCKGGSVLLCVPLALCV